MICRRHHLDAVGAVLIREMRIEAKAGIVPVVGVDVAGGIAALGGAKKLAVGGGGRSVAPYRCDRQGVMRIDDSHDRRYEIILDNCRRFLAGQPLRNLVDKARWF